MKAFNRIVIFLLVIIITVLGPVTYLNAESALPDVSAHSYVIMDSDTGEVLYQQNGNKKIYPASTVKIMTAIVALENCKLSKKIKIKKSVLTEISQDAYTLGLKVGDSYTLNNLLHMLLLNSAADAADSIAVGVCKTKKAFIKKMNQKAKELGMNHTSFDNTVGLDIGNQYNNTYSTAKDMAILTKYAMSNKTFRKIVNKAVYTVPKTKKSKAIKLENTNLFLKDQPYSNELYKIIGTKTGTTKAAGKVLITTAKDSEGTEVICAFFGNKTKDRMYLDIRKLLDYVFG